MIVTSWYQGGHRGHARANTRHRPTTYAGHEMAPGQVRIRLQDNKSKDRLDIVLSFEQLGEWLRRLVDLHDTYKADFLPLEDDNG